MSLATLRINTVSRLRIAILALFVFSGILPGQSVIPQAVNETINLAPRAKKGDLQQYLLTYEISRMLPDGTVMSIKTDYLNYSQVCTSNSPEAGISYQITVDSLVIGTGRKPGEPEGLLQTAHQFDGYTFKWNFNRKVRIENGCYDFQVPLPDYLGFVEGWEFQVHMAYVQLWEQGRFLLGRQLAKVGDTASFSIGAPICIGIPDVVKSHRLSLSRQRFELTGISNYKGRACAVVKVHESSAPTFVDLATIPDSTFVARGKTSLAGELWISLDKGAIVQAIWRTRTDAAYEDPRFKGTTSHVSDIYWLRQLN